MSLYRQQGRRNWGLIAVSAVVALLVGAGAGYAIGRSSAPDPSLTEQIAEVQGEVQPVLNGIALVPDHYAQSVRGGEVVEPVQYEGATQQVAAAQDALEAAAPDLQTLNANAYAAAQESLQALAQAVEGKQDAAEVSRLADEAQTAVNAATGGS